jgi:predicted Zn-dependent protease
MGCKRGAALGQLRVPRFLRGLWAASGKSGRTPRATIALIFALLLSGCISEEREIEIGNTMAAAINPRLPLIDDPLLDAYLYSIGEKIGWTSARPEISYHFYLVDSPIVNAFALPGGHIYLTRGLIDRTRTGSEFAGVLAHEIGHVAARHGVRKLQRELRTGSLVSLLYETILGGEPALLRENPMQLATFVWSARHSRRDEREADRLAVRYLAHNGVDPGGVVTLLETLLHEEQLVASDPVQVDWFSTHPLTTERVQNARDEIQDVEVEAGAISAGDLKAFDAFKVLLAFRGSTGPKLDW